ncbi:MAG: lysylphosphatidylglycerol synthase transmembrane domain-containing protein, partial [Actinomycetota bacterium]|nr:lysylphosphatidylglycerol synthase transmembrane domain-containing protein [Actinomycetota bacterium]
AQIPGEQLLRAYSDRGDPLVVKVYGRDAWDAQFVGSLWNSMTTRGEYLQVTAGRRERVEHESFALLLAERAGVSVLPLVAAGESVEGDALLVTDGAAMFFESIPADQIDAAMLADAWTLLADLHATGIAHRRIDSERLVMRDNGSLALTDFAQARTTAGSGDLLIDRARLLVTLALKVGIPAAITSATAALGSAGLGEALSYVQSPVLTRDMRREIDSGSWTLDELTGAAVAATGDELPPMEQIRRVTTRSLLKFGLIALFVFWLLSLISGVDFSEVLDALETANLWWLLAALLLSPVIQVAFAFSTLGSTMTRLRYGPVLLLQYAIQFIAVALPATAARLALEVRFFRKFGIAPGPAITMGVIDSVSGFVVQIGLIIFILLSGLPGLTMHPNSESSSSDTTSTESSSPSLLALVAVIALVALVISVVLPKRRARLKELLRRGRLAVVAEVRNASSSLVVLRKPSKIASMLGGNLGAQILQAIVLGLCLLSFGESADLSQLILINTAVSLFAGLMPVPGGVGVAEAGYTFGLQAIGIPSSIAISTALAFRLVTFYLPPIWGSISTRWLRQHEYI